MKLTLVDKKQELIDVVSFIFKPEQPITWVAGQFMRYHLEDPSPDQRTTNRFFTIASAPYEENIMVTTRFVPGDGSTFKKDLLKLVMGDSIEASGPGGDFVIDPPAGGPNLKYVFIAGGIGITPFRSILLDLNYRKLPIDVTLLYANRSQDIIYKDELEALTENNPNFKLYYFIDPNRIDEKAIREHIPNLNSVIFYISGPEPMVEAFGKLFLEMGVPKAHIKQDFFPGYDKP